MAAQRGLIDDDNDINRARNMGDVERPGFGADPDSVEHYTDFVGIGAGAGDISFNAGEDDAGEDDVNEDGADKDGVSEDDAGDSDVGARDVGMGEIGASDVDADDVDSDISDEEAWINVRDSVAELTRKLRDVAGSVFIPVSGTASRVAWADASREIPEPDPEGIASQQNVEVSKDSADTTIVTASPKAASASNVTDISELSDIPEATDTLKTADTHNVANTQIVIDAPEMSGDRAVTQDTIIYQSAAAQVADFNDKANPLPYGLYGDDRSHQQTFELPPLTRLTKKAPKETEEEKNGVELWKILLAILICMLVAMGSYLVGQVYGATLIPDEPVIAQHEPTPDDPEVVSEAPPDPGPRILTMLLIGTDQRYKNELARADTIILIAMNLDTYDINMISIPRDTRVQIPDMSGYYKINHSHAVGGAELTVKTVESLFGINIHYYAETNFKGFERCVDILGGLEYTVEKRMYFPEEGIDLSQGKQRLNGDKALQYVRWRGEPSADIGRVARQQKFVKALLEQSMSFATIPKIPSLISALRENVLTDMSGAQMLNLAFAFAGNISDINFTGATLPGEAKTVNGAAYWIMDESAAFELIMSILAPTALETQPGQSGIAPEPQAITDPAPAPESQSSADTQPGTAAASAAPAA